MATETESQVDLSVCRPGDRCHTRHGVEMLFIGANPEHDGNPEGYPFQCIFDGKLRSYRSDGRFVINSVSNWDILHVTRVVGQVVQITPPVESPATGEAGMNMLREALRRIAKWSGEFPDTGRKWDDGSPMSYSAAFGSNGERDYMREVAQQALDLEADYLAESRAYIRDLIRRDMEPKPKAAIPDVAVCFFKDGDKWCAVCGDFKNLMESPAGFGDSFDAALLELQKAFGRSPPEMPSVQ